LGVIRIVDQEISQQLRDLSANGQTRWVIWIADDGASTIIFDTESNRPADLDDQTSRRAVEMMRAAGAIEVESYPGRPCSS
jgi:hypothetical protein